MYLIISVNYVIKLREINYPNLGHTCYFIQGLPVNDDGKNGWQKLQGLFFFNTKILV